MDLKDVKAFIRSLIMTSKKPYTVSELVESFESEAGISLPIFNFDNPKDFLKSLTDTVKFVGKPPNEEIQIVPSKKSQHIVSLIEKQKRNTFFYNSPRQYKFSQRIPSPVECFNAVTSDDSKAKRKNLSKEQTVSICNGKLHDKVYSNNHDRDCIEDFVFVDDDINDLDDNIISSSNTNNTFKNSNSSENGSEISCMEYSHWDDNVPQSPIDHSNEYLQVNDDIKEKLKKLIQNRAEGIWCSELPDLYMNSYDSPLEFEELGYRSLIDMCKELTEIFICTRPGICDWLLFDASNPPAQEVMGNLISQCVISEVVEKNMVQLLRSFCEDGSKPGIYLEDILILYFKKFRTTLNFIELGYPNIRTLLTQLDGHVLRLERDGNRFIIKPLLDEGRTAAAIPSITPKDDIFKELFPADVVKEGEKFEILKIENYFHKGEKVDVILGDIISPVDFHIKLKKHKSEFDAFIRDLEIFYTKNQNKYKMPAPTVQPKQICITLCNMEDGSKQWQRSVIYKVMEENVVLELIDYGGKFIVKRDKLRFLCKDFFHFPVQTFKAGLSSIKPRESDGNSWSMDACETFLELVEAYDAKFHVNIIDSEKQKLSGDLIMYCGKRTTSVCTYLISLGLAEIKGTNVENCNKTNIQKLQSELNDRKIDHKEAIESKENSITNDENRKSKNVEDITVPEEILPFVESCAEVLSNWKSSHFFDLRADIIKHALAFRILMKSDRIKSKARKDLEEGVEEAMDLARKLIKKAS